MTRDEAQVEAVRRWGAEAKVYIWVHHFVVCASEPVGNVDRSKPYGKGDSWQSAFADADRKEVKP